MPSPTTTVLFFLLLHYAAAYNPDAHSLLLFKSAADPKNTILTSWNASTDPCTATWLGVTCLRHRVSRLVLENLRLNGTFPRSVASLTGLRVLSLKKNGFSGQIPDLSNLTGIKLLFLSHNHFSGDFPISITTLSKLRRLDLSFNNFTGIIPAAVENLTNLLTLKLEENGFSGSIQSFRLPNLHDFNVSGNRLSGQIPDPLSSFPMTSFLNNLKLCGPPLEKCNNAVPTFPTPSNGSNESGKPIGTKPITDNVKSRRSKFSSLAIAGIILGDMVVLGLISVLLYCYFRRSNSTEFDSGKSSGSVEITGYPNPVHSSQEKGRIVFFEAVRRFELEDLLRASAEMLGKGGFGTAYKAVLDDGDVVAVKRLKDLFVNGKKEFEQQMDVLGKLRHPNLVELKAYYFAKDEKLLVYDYMPNGSLFWLLHGNRGPGRTPLDWTSRLKIAAGAARGLQFIHTSCKPIKLVHGNIKSTNILIDKDFSARVSDFGLSTLASSLPRSNGYRAPESSSSDGRRLTQKSDVYSFGVLLLELLTGKCPSVVESSGSPNSGEVVDLPRWVGSVVREEWTAEVFDFELMMRDRGFEEEMVGLLQIGVACAQASPERRPEMGSVVKMIDELRRVSPSHSPAVSDGAGKTSE